LSGRNNWAIARAMKGSLCSPYGNQKEILPLKTSCISRRRVMAVVAEMRRDIISAYSVINDNTMAGIIHASRIQLIDVFRDRCDNIVVLELET